MKVIIMIMLLTAISVSSAKSQNSMESPNQNTVNLDASNPEFVCLLTDSEFVQRRKDMLNDVFAHITEVEELGDGYTFHFHDDELLLPNLFNYILAEKKCCPFFQQEVIIRPHKEGISWKVSGKEGVKEVVKILLEDAGLREE